MSRVSNIGNWSAGAFMSTMGMYIMHEMQVNPKALRCVMLKTETRAFVACGDVSIKVKNALVVANRRHHHSLGPQGFMAHDRVRKFGCNLLTMPLCFVDSL